MSTSERMYRVRFNVIGGGFVLREGDIVRESELPSCIAWLQQEGGIEELREASVSKDGAKPAADKV